MNKTERSASGRAAASLPLVLGTVTAALQWLVWRGFHGVPAISDEAAYVLQARNFAHFRWTAPSPPIRAFFEQMHVLLSPGIASKYPPGHSLLLAVGAFFGAPGLVPVILSGFTAGLLFALSRRLGNTWIALLAWLTWTCLPIQESIRPSYFSQVTTLAMWLAGWWALMQWRDDGRTRWLVLLSLFTAWGAITRPLTAVAYAIPTGIATLVLIRRRRAWRPMWIALAAGLVVIAILPVWNWRTTGDVRLAPYNAYDRTYLPFQRFGFGDNGAPAPTWLPRDLYAEVRGMSRIQAGYTLDKVPREAALRLYYTWKEYFGDAGWSALLSMFAVIGGFVTGVEGLIALAAIVCLFVVHLAWATPAPWTIYYYEAIPAVCFFAAAGLWRVFAVAGSWRRRSDADAVAFARRGMIAVTLVCLPFALATQGAKRVRKAAFTAAQTYFLRGVETLPKPAIVFVRYAPGHLVAAALVDNDPDLARASVWKVYDRGDAENARLRALAPERHAYVYVEAVGKFFALP